MSSPTTMEATALETELRELRAQLKDVQHKLDDVRRTVRQEAQVGLLKWLGTIIFGLPVVGSVLQFLFILNLIALVRILVLHPVVPDFAQSAFLTVFAYFWRGLGLLFYPLTSELKAFMKSTHVLELGEALGGSLGGLVGSVSRGLTNLPSAGTVVAAGEEAATSLLSYLTTFSSLLK